MTKIVAIIQARMSSTRLPGKVLKLLEGKTVLEHVIDRVKLSNVDDVIIATTNKKEDLAIVSLCKKLNVNYYQGDLNNVLSRYYEAALKYKADIIVRITPDCPLYDPVILNQMLESYNIEECDYFSNSLERSFPRGLDTEIFTFKTLEKSYKEAKEQYQLEHVTPYIYQNPHKFNIKGFVNKKDLSNHRWTLDTKEDYQMIKEIYKALYKKDKEIFSTEEVLKFLDQNPQIFAINSQIKQKAINENSN